MAQNYTFFLSGASDKTTNSNVQVSNEKGDIVVSEGQESVTVDPKAQETGDVQQNTTSEVGTPTEAPAPSSGGLFGGGWISLILIYVAFGFGFYFLAIRPQKKKQKEAQAMIEALVVGDEILTSSGYYGKITDIKEEICVVEFGTNKGVRIPIRKSEILRKETPQI